MIKIKKFSKKRKRERSMPDITSSLQKLKIDKQFILIAFEVGIDDEFSDFIFYPVNPNSGFYEGDPISLNKIKKDYPGLGDKLGRALDKVGLALNFDYVDIIITIDKKFIIMDERGNIVQKG